MPPRRWTTEELNTADKMLSDGASFVDIGKAIDRSAAAVESKLKGKSTPKPKPAPQKQEKAESTKPKAPTVEERPAVTEPQQTASNDDGARQLNRQIYCWRSDHRCYYLSCAWRLGTR